jgi:hypothetical protein
MAGIVELLTRLQHDHSFLSLFRSDPASSMAGYDLSHEQRANLLTRDPALRSYIEAAGVRIPSAINVRDDPEPPTPEPVPFPFDPNWPPAPPPSPPIIPDVSPPPVNDFKVYVKVWPIGTRQIDLSDAPIDLQQVQRLAQVARTSTGRERLATLVQMMEEL